MQVEWINIGLAFFEGLALILSPCILPILPIMLAGSLTGKKSRPLGIIIGFVLTFAIVTLFSRTLLNLMHINPETLRNISYAMLLLLGVIMISSYLTYKFTLFTQRLTNVGSSFSTVNDTQSGFWSGLLFGGLVGIIWTPCAGPILAAVIVQAIVQKTNLASILVVFSFGIGAALPMLFIALIGRKLIDEFSFLRRHTVFIRKLLGIIIIASVFFLIYSISIFPTFTVSNTTQTDASSLVNGLEYPYPAPQIAGIDAWINSQPLQISNLKGKVILIDFWTYSCINCLRTLPYLKAWYAKYHDQGLEIIGIHSPEFLFEHSFENVKKAVENYGIHYPVALDNNFATWQNFHNEYWPAHYLINKEGFVVYEHFGEGEYDVTENNIRYLLGLKNMPATESVDDSFVGALTPETYFGYARAERFHSQEAMSRDQSTTYHYTENLDRDAWALQGSWLINRDKIIATSANASIKLHFRGGKVYAVMGSEKPIAVQLILNGVKLKTLEVKQPKLYTLVESNKEKEGTLEIITDQPGLEMYTFTFGN